MINKLEEVADRFREVEGLLADPTVLNNQSRYRALSKEHAELSELVTVYQRYSKVCAEVADSRELLKDSDPDLREMARRRSGSKS